MVKASLSLALVHFAAISSALPAWPQPSLLDHAQHSPSLKSRDEKGEEPWDGLFVFRLPGEPGAIVSNGDKRVSQAMRELDNFVSRPLPFNPFDLAPRVEDVARELGASIEEVDEEEIVDRTGEVSRGLKEFSKIKERTEKIETDMHNLLQQLKSDADNVCRDIHALQRGEDCNVEDERACAEDYQELNRKYKAAVTDAVTRFIAAKNPADRETRKKEVAKQYGDSLGKGYFTDAIPVKTFEDFFDIYATNLRDECRRSRAHFIQLKDLDLLPPPNGPPPPGQGPP